MKRFLNDRLIGLAIMIAPLVLGFLAVMGWLPLQRGYPTMHPLG